MPETIEGVAHREDRVNAQMRIILLLEYGDYQNSFFKLAYLF